MGGCDKQGFPMKQGVLTPGRVRLLLHRGNQPTLLLHIYIYIVLDVDLHCFVMAEQELLASEDMEGGLVRGEESLFVVAL